MRKIKRIILIVSLFAAPLLSKAQPPGPPGGGGGGNPPCWPPPCVPIDGGISILLVAGLLYGGKKLYGYNKKLKEAE